MLSNTFFKSGASYNFDEAVEHPQTIFANNFWAARGSSGVNYLGNDGDSVKMTGPDARRFWDYNRYECDASSIFDFEGYRNLDYMRFMYDVDHETRRVHADEVVTNIPSLRGELGSTIFMSPAQPASRTGRL